MYHNFIFDLYGTLVDIHTNENKTSLWKRLPAGFPHLTPVRRSAPQIFFELFMSKKGSNPQRLF